MDFMDFVPNGFEESYRGLTRRKDGCVTCPKTIAKCPVCPTGKTCSQTSQTCTECAKNICLDIDAVAMPSPTSDPSVSSGQSDGDGGSNIPAIAGGVVGGVVFIAIVTFLVWRFCIKNRQDDFEEEYEDSYPSSEQKSGFGMSPNKRSSTHTMGSVASTMNTRSSNVIPIAFIPGITGGYDMVPPVPPIPASPANTPRSGMQDHYFMLGDLRDSAYSGFSDTTVGDNRISTAPSITPSLLRQSVASTIYHESQVGHIPAQTAQRGKAAVVSVQRSGNNTPKPGSPSIPAVPEIDYAKFGNQGQAKQNANEAAVQQNLSVKPTLYSPTPQNQAVQANSNVQATIEEAARRASRQPTHGGLGSVRADNHQASPFSDANALPSSPDPQELP